MPLISVIVPAYNVEKYIEKCINSIIGQTFRDFEVLLIDDGASDSTPKICDEAAKKDGRIKVIHKNNGGLSDARNCGLEIAKGKYITFIDSDDFVSADYLETLYDLITSENDIDIAMLPAVITQEGNDPIRSEEDKGNSCEVMSERDAVQKMLLSDDVGHEACAKLYISKLWRDIRFPKGKNYEDYATTYNVFAEARKVVFSNKRKYYYVMRKNSIMHNKCSESTLAVLDIADDVTDFIIRRWSDCRVEAVRLQVVTYLKNMQAILNLGENAFEKYQERILNNVKHNARLLLTAPQVAIRDKLKIIALLLNKKIYLKLYNIFDGNIKL